MTDTPLIPRRHLFGSPRRTGAQISPDGKWLGWSEPVDGVSNIWIAPRSALELGQPVTHERRRDIRSFVWSADSRYVLISRDGDGDEAFRVYAIERETGVMRDLSPVEGGRTQITAISRERVDEIVLSVHGAGAQWADLWRVSLTGGEPECILHNQGMAGFVLDEAYAVRLGLRREAGGGLAVLRAEDGGSRFKELFAFSAEDAGVSGVLGIDAAGTTLYLRDSRNRDTAALVAMDMASGDTRLLAHDPRADIGGTLAHHESHVPLAAFVTAARRETIVLDATIARDIARLEAMDVGDWFLTSRSRDDRFWTIATASDTKPATIWLYDRDAGSLEVLFEGRPELGGALLAPMQVLEIAARDGLALTCYLTLPIDHTPDAAALPLVLLVHGGPWARDHFGFSSEHQWLANRGYAVLSVNFRGSTGFGKSFLDAGDREWGARMDDDLEDATDWLVGRGIVDPARIAIMGTSYGGYATLSGLTRTPLRYACGIDVVGPANLETLLAATPAHWESFRERLYRSVGDPRSEAGRAFLRDRSPLHRASRIARPLLIAQGANDIRVPRAEADAMVEAMTAQGIPVTYLLFPDEGHGFSRPANQIAFRIAAERFLASHLGGRCQPAEPGEDAGTTMQELC